MKVRAKLALVAIHDWHYGMSQPQRTLRFECRYDTSIPEDQRFQQATPTGHVELQIDNPAVLAQFTVGKSYYIDFSPAE